MSLTEQDVQYLERAMALAERARGCTTPNPLVGAVIVAQGRVLGEGYHLRPGADHAEIAAIKDAIARAAAEAAAQPGGSGATVRPDYAGSPSGTVRPDYAGSPTGAGPTADLEGKDWIEAARQVCQGATMYVTLEPCCTYGRTPPCTDALIAAGFSRVVVGAVDPSPAVNGRGLELLRAAGIEVEVADGPLALRLKRQNSGPRKWAVTGLPFVTYKYAMTVDGRTATDSGDSRWISSPESRALVHQWRAWSDAVMVGAGTVAVDDPLLTAREVACEKQPLRVVVDRHLSLSRESRLVETVKEGPVVVICSPEVPAERRADVESWGVETVALPDRGGARQSDAKQEGAGPGLLEVFQYLGSHTVQSVLLEGGRRLAGACWEAEMIDKIAAFIAPRVVSGRENRAPLVGAGAATMADAAELREVETRRVGADLLVCGYTGEAF